MPLSSTPAAPRLRYHADAYEFLFEALRFAQRRLERIPADAGSDTDGEEAHVSGGELLEGIRGLALERFGLMARIVFASWGIHCTEDFGRMVFELIEEGRMRKTDRDQLSDFYEVYEFREALERAYSPRTDFTPTR